MPRALTAEERFDAESELAAMKKARQALLTGERVYNVNYSSGGASRGVTFQMGDLTSIRQRIIELERLLGLRRGVYSVRL